jgi:hypothetical protein
MSLNILTKKREDCSEKKQGADAIYSSVDKAYYVDTITYKIDNTTSYFDDPY